MTAPSPVGGLKDLTCRNPTHCPRPRGVRLMCNMSTYAGTGVAVKGGRGKFNGEQRSQVGKGSSGPLLAMAKRSTCREK